MAEASNQDSQETEGVTDSPKKGKTFYWALILHNILH